jgi:8-oxo-dGTP pyrophosphatase MutT (NUDIX family)
MADGSGVAQSLMIAKAKLALAMASQAKDGDGDGFVNDGPDQSPATGAPPKEPGSNPVPSAAGTSINSGVIAKLGAERAIRLKKLIEGRAPADQIAEALRPAAEGADSIPPTLAADQTPTPEFWASRKYEGGKGVKETVDGLVEKAKSYAGGEVLQEHKAVLVVGAPAAGKSTFAEQMSVTMGAAIWDSDDAKTVIPEFQGGIGANAVHHESKMLTAFVGKRLLDEGDNIVHPVIGHDVGKLKALMGQFKDAGYEVDVVHVAVSPDEAMRRMAGRYLATGRLIPPDYFLSVADKPASTYHGLRDSGALSDGYAEIDANGPRGTAVVTEANHAPAGLSARQPVQLDGGKPSGRPSAQGAQRGAAGAGQRKPVVRKGLQGTLISTAEARLALARASVGVEKAKLPGVSWFFDAFKHPRKPSGSPEGGEFAPKGSSLSGGMDDAAWNAFFADEASGGKGPGKPKMGLFGGYWGGAGDHQTAATRHPAADDKGREVWIERPSRPSAPESWGDPDAVATFVPHGDGPHELNGVAFKSWTPPKDWASLPSNPAFEVNPPQGGTKTFTGADGKVITTPYHVGAGVIIREPDGRVWLTQPTNGFGGYRNTFPKGTVEHGLNLQQSAIKEAYEETGLHVKITGVLGDFKRTTSTARFFLAERIGGTPRDMGWESQSVRLAPAGDLRKLLNVAHVDHPIVDAYEALHGPPRTGRRVTKAYNPDQPRWPAGTPLGGQWMGMDPTSGLTLPPKLGWKKDGSGPGTNANVYNKVVLLHEAASKGNTQLLQDWQNSGWGDAEYKQFLATGGKGMNAQAKWKAQTKQYGMHLLDQMQSQTMATAAAEAATGPEKISGWTLVGAKPGGSAPGGVYTDKSGQKWLVKGNQQGKDDERAKNEVLASKLMQLSGIPAPEYKLVDLGSQYGGGLGVAVKWNPNLTDITGLPSHKALVQDQFAVHAWLGNYDSIGTGKSVGGSDNFMMDKVTGEAVMIDPGGALLYRAQGKKKDSFLPTAPEWESMRDPGVNAHSAAFYGSMTQSQLQASAEKLAAMKGSDIHSLVMEFGPGDEVARNKLSDTLLQRRNSIMAKMKVGPFAEEPKVTSHGVEPETLESLGAAVPKVYKQHFDEWVADGNIDQMKTAHANWAKSGTTSEYGGPDGVNTKYLAALIAKHEAQAAAPAADHVDKLFKEALDFNGNTVPYGTLKGAKDAYDNGDIAQLKTYVELWTNNTSGATTKGPGGPWTLWGKAAVAKLEGGDAPAKLRAVPVLLTDAQAAKLSYGKADVGIMNDWAKEGDKASLEHVAESYLKIANEGGDNSGSMLALSGHAKALLAQMKGEKPAEMAAAMQASDAVKVAAAEPNWDAAMTQSQSNLYNNNKVWALKKLYEKGDAKGILALGYGSNTFAKKHVQVANDALAAMGSQEKVALSQKPNSHPALGGVAVDNSKVITEAAKAGAGKKKLKPITAADLPPKPDFANFKGPGQGLSSKAWKNGENQAAVDRIAAVALKGDLGTLKGMTFKVKADTEGGEYTGEIKGMNLHPSKYVSAYYNDAVQFLNDYYNPVELPTIANALRAKSLAQVASHFKPKPLLTTVESLHKNERFGFWMSLGHVSNAESLRPAKVSDLSPGEIASGKSWYQGLSGNPDGSKLQTFVSGMTGGGMISYFRTGSKSYSGVSTQALAEAAIKHAPELGEGKTIYRWQNMDHSMLDALNKAQPGMVLAANGPMPASYSPTATKNFGQYRFVIRAAKGAKAIPSHGNGSYPNEKEISILPNSRFVYLGKKPSTGGKGGYDYELLMLPPHPDQAKVAKS